MSTTGFGSFLIAKPEVEWKSAWRREFERRSAEEAAARRLAARQAARQNPLARVVVAPPKPKVVRAAAEPRPKRVRATVDWHACPGGCGRSLREGFDTCWRCKTAARDHKCWAEGCEVRLRGMQKLCAGCREKSLRQTRFEKHPERRCGWEGCERVLRSGNRTGYCKHCWRAHRHQIPKRGWGVCKFEADGMRCCERIRAGSLSGLCGFHNPAQCYRDHYRSRKPQMVAIAESEAAA